MKWIYLNNGEEMWSYRTSESGEDRATIWFHGGVWHWVTLPGSSVEPHCATREEAMDACVADIIFNRMAA